LRAALPLRLNRLLRCALQIAASWPVCAAFE